MRLKAISRQSLELSFGELWTLIKGLFSREQKVLNFEEEFARYIGVKHAVSFSSLRTGFFWTLKSVGFNKGDEIIIPAYGFYAVPAIVVLAKLKPVFVDVNPKNYTIDSEKIEKAITQRTKAIVVAHLNGYPADMNKIKRVAKKHQLRVIEDCAHACGSEFDGKKLGSFDIGCFSFGPGKNLSTMGGGMITVDDSALAERLKQLRVSPIKEGFILKLKILLKAIAMRLLTLPSVFLFTTYPLFLIAQLVNLNFLLRRLEEKIEIPQKPPSPLPLSPLQARLGVEQLKRLEKRNQIRIRNASFYNQRLDKLRQVQILPAVKKGKNIYLHYPLKMDNVSQFIRKMALKKIDIQKDYCSVCSELEIFKEFKTDCPVAKSLKGKIVYLPNHPSIGKSEITYIGKITRKTLS